MITIFSSNVNMQRRNIGFELSAMRQEMATLREELIDPSLQMKVANVTHAKETNYLYQEIHSLQRHIIEAQTSCPHRDRSCMSI